MVKLINIALKCLQFLNELIQSGALFGVLWVQILQWSHPDRRKVVVLV